MKLDIAQLAQQLKLEKSNNAEAFRLLKKLSGAAKEVKDLEKVVGSIAKDLTAQSERIATLEYRIADLLAHMEEAREVKEKIEPKPETDQFIDLDDDIDLDTVEPKKRKSWINWSAVQSVAIVVSIVGAIVLANAFVTAKLMAYELGKVTVASQPFVEKAGK